MMTTSSAASTLTLGAIQTTAERETSQPLAGIRGERNLDFCTICTIFILKNFFKNFSIFFTKPLDKSVNLCYNSLVSKEHTDQKKGK